MDSRKECERQSALAESHGDTVGTTVWGRVNEHSRKLALLHAISENARSPRISLAAAQWATALVITLSISFAKTPFPCICHAIAA